MASEDSKWHIDKKFKIIKDYPKIKEFQKPYPYSIFYILFLILIQISVGLFIQVYDFSILDIGLISFINANSLFHSLSSFIHENSHGLVVGYENRYLISLLLELGLMGFGDHVNYEVTHKRNHHPNLNLIEIDSECSNKKHISSLSNIFENVYLNRLFFIVDLLPLGSILSQEFAKSQLSENEKIEIEKIKSNFSIGFFDKLLKFSLFLVSLLIFIYMIYKNFYKFLLFRIWSASIYSGKFSIMRRGQSISEHKAEEYNSNSPTKSTYCFWSNVLFFNTGYHDEHHTFPAVPWKYLPKIKEIAPEYFKNENEESYFELWHRWYDSDFKNNYYRKCQ